MQTKPINTTREAKTMPPAGMSDDALYDYYEGIVDFLRSQENTQLYRNSDGRVFW